MAITIFGIFVFILAYVGIGSLLSFAVYDGGRHSIFLVFFYPLIIAFICILTTVIFISGFWAKE